MPSSCENALSVILLVDAIENGTVIRGLSGSLADLVQNGRVYLSGSGLDSGNVANAEVLNNDESVCGNGVCEMADGGESFSSCPNDCAADTCGDGECVAGTESCTSCARDCCPNQCGNGCELCLFVVSRCFVRTNYVFTIIVEFANRKIQMVLKMDQHVLTIAPAVGEFFCFLFVYLFVCLLFIYLFWSKKNVTKLNISQS